MPDKERSLPKLSISPAPVSDRIPLHPALYTDANDLRRSRSSQVCNLFAADLLPLAPGVVKEDSKLCVEPLANSPLLRRTSRKKISHAFDNVSW